MSTHSCFRVSTSTANSNSLPDATEKHSESRRVLFASFYIAQKRSTQTYANKPHAKQYQEKHRNLKQQSHGCYCREQKSASAMNKNNLTESEARQSNWCPSCHKPKDTGCVVCWECFKYQTPSGAESLKNSGLSFEEWLPTAQKDGAALAEKTLAYAYPSSTNAALLGHAKTGCWYVGKEAFKTEAEALAYGETLPGEWSRWSMNTMRLGSDAQDFNAPQPRLPHWQWAFYDSHGLPGLVGSDRPSDKHERCVVVPAAIYSQVRAALEDALLPYAGMNPDRFIPETARRIQGLRDAQMALRSSDA